MDGSGQAITSYARRPTPFQEDEDDELLEEIR